MYETMQENVVLTAQNVSCHFEHMGGKGVVCTQKHERIRQKTGRAALVPFCFGLCAVPLQGQDLQGSSKALTTRCFAETARSSFSLHSRCVRYFFVAFFVIFSSPNPQDGNSLWRVVMRGN